MKSLASLSHFQQKNCAPNMRKIGRLQKWNASHFEQKFSLQLWTILALINLLVQLRVLFNFDTAKEFQLCKNIELKFGKHKLCWQVIQKSILILNSSTETWFSMTKRKTARLQQFLPVRALIQFQPNTLNIQSRKTSYLIAGQDHPWHQQQHQQDPPPTVGELRLGLLARVVVLRRHRLHVRTVSPSLALQQLFFRELGFS